MVQYARRYFAEEAMHHRARYIQQSGTQRSCRSQKGAKNPKFNAIIEIVKIEKVSK